VPTGSVSVARGRGIPRVRGIAGPTASARAGAAPRVRGITRGTDIPPTGAAPPQAESARHHRTFQEAEEQTDGYRSEGKEGEEKQRLLRRWHATVPGAGWIDRFT